LVNTVFVTHSIYSNKKIKNVNNINNIINSNLCFANEFKNVFLQNSKTQSMLQKLIDNAKKYLLESTVIQKDVNVKLASEKNNKGAYKHVLMGEKYATLSKK
jgi:hypothetical protein